jgi:hypothetical protein
MKAAALSLEVHQQNTNNAKNGKVTMTKNTLTLACSLASLLALGGCSSATDAASSSENSSNNNNNNDNAVSSASSDTATVTTRSSQGINEDARDRRDHAKNRVGRHDFKHKKQQEREIRSYDGTSNNIENPVWGASWEHLQRMASSDYSDGISAMAGQQRESARVISNLVANQGGGVNIPNTFGTSDFLWQWGQFIDHDIDLTDGSTNESQDIIVPAGDIYFDPQESGSVVMSFHRAIYDMETGTSTSNPRQQENEITSWIDGSMIYGSDDARASALREGDDSPFLASSTNNLLPFNSQDLTNASGFVRDTQSLFLAGDVRANENVTLTAMHTLWMREHNRIAKQLMQNSARKNDNLSGTDIFEKARILVIAQIQKITYEEYLPALIGDNTLAQYQGYDSSIKANIYNEFSSAAYRLGHSEIGETLVRLNENGQEVDEGSIALRNGFFSGIQLLKSQNDIDPFLRGLAQQRHQAIDVQVVEDLRNFLFGQPGQGGFDLISLNIQRGRDTGLSSYNDTRQALGLSRFTEFSQITDDTNLQESLQSAYASIDDIDLWVGGMAETPLTAQGSQLGELFTKIVAKQFNELRAGDRFWYQNYLNRDELDFIKDVTLSKVIKNNTNIKSELQDNVFYVPDTP